MKIHFHWWGGEPRKGWDSPSKIKSFIGRWKNCNISTAGTGGGSPPGFVPRGFRSLCHVQHVWAGRTNRSVGLLAGHSVLTALWSLWLCWGNAVTSYIYMSKFLHCDTRFGRSEIPNSLFTWTLNGMIRSWRAYTYNKCLMRINPLVHAQLSNLSGNSSWRWIGTSASVW